MAPWLRDDRLHVRQQIAVTRDRHEGPIRLVGLAYVVLGVPGRHPDDSSPSTLDLGQVPHGREVDAAHGAVQTQAAEHLHARHHLAYELGELRRLVPVLLDDESAHAARLGEPGQLDRVE
jgi:hypothetical protein